MGPIPTDALGKASPTYTKFYTKLSVFYTQKEGRERGMTLLI